MQNWYGIPPEKRFLRGKALTKRQVLCYDDVKFFSNSESKSEVYSILLVFVFLSLFVFHWIIERVERTARRRGWRLLPFNSQDLISNFPNCSPYMQFLRCLIGEFGIGSINNPLIDTFTSFSSLLCLILYWNCLETFSLSHSWEVKG